MMVERVTVRIAEVVFCSFAVGGRGTSRQVARGSLFRIHDIVMEFDSRVHRAANFFYSCG